MSKEQQNIINELLQAISDSATVSDMSYSTGRELTALVRQLEVA